MYAKAKDQGCKGKTSLGFLILNIVIAFSTGVITANMANQGCSKAFAAVAVMSFIWIFINLLLICSQSVWNRTFSFIFMFLYFVIVLITLVGLGFAAYQSVCNIIACASNFQSNNDAFYRWFRSDDTKSKFEDYCDKLSNPAVEDYVLGYMAMYNEKNFDQKYYIVKGWPIAFCVIQFLLTLLQLVLTYFNLYSCSGCKPQKKEQTQIQYF